MKFSNQRELRRQAIKFENEGFYCDAPRGTKGYYEYWDEQKRRCLEGYSVGDLSITGYHYYYLNFGRIERVFETQNGAEEQMGFPLFYDWDYNYFWSLYIAKNGITEDKYEDLDLDVNIDDLSGGNHMAVIKARRKGYSYKAASMLARNFCLKQNSKNYAMVSDSEYLLGDGLFSKTWDQLAFMEENTPFGQPKLTDQKLKKVSGYKEKKRGIEVEKGTKNAIIGISLKDNPEKAVGKSGELGFFEEAGKFPGLIEAWEACRPSYEQGKYTTGTMIAYGCVCEGTKVWNNNGDLVNIENLNKEDGILGFNRVRQEISKEDISYWKDPAKKECVEITTNTGRSLRCSIDHPILWSRASNVFTKESHRVNGKRRRKKFKDTEFKRADNIEVGDQLAVAREVDVFGDKEMWEPRIVGWLIGDGSYGIDKTPVLSNCDEEVNSYIENNFETTTERTYKTSKNKDYKETRIRNICPELRKLEIYGQTKLDKTLPKNIHSYQKEDICELLGGFFDADGCVTRDEINLTSSSKDLLYEVLILLQKLGIHGNINEIDERDRDRKDEYSSISSENLYYRLEIRDKKSVIAFYNNIDFFPSYKQEKLSDIVDDYLKKSSEDANHLPGLKFERVVNIKDIGEQKIYNLTANNTNTYLANGIVTHNTGGTKGADYEGLEELFFNPENYNVIPIKNKWDDASESNTCSFFVPAYVNLEGFIDNNGKSKVEEAKTYLNQEREEKQESDDPRGYNKHVAQFPFTPREATMRVDNNIFPTNELNSQLSEVISKNKHKALTSGTLYREEGEVKFNPDANVNPIFKFPTPKDTDRRGGVVIKQTPYKTDAGRVPDNMYMICHDPYAHDGSPEGSSLGAAYVIKRVNDIDLTYANCPVASYVGRPLKQDTYNRNLFLLAEYYNAKIAFENNRGNVMEYAKNNNLLHRLYEKPNIQENRHRSRPRTTRTYGLTMSSKSMKNQAEVYIRDWLLEEYAKSAEGKRTLVLNKILDPALLKELANYNEDGNFDRVSALMVGMYYLRQLQNQKVRKQDPVEEHSDFFNRELFPK